MVSIKIDDVSKAVSGKAQDSISAREITGVSTDARSIAAGEVFFALKGEHFDGHHFVNDALKKGAACAVVSEIPQDIPIESPLIIVDDTLIAYGDLAAYYRTLFQIPIVAVTGSVGKTTARNMICSVLETRFKVLQNEANFNNEIGVPKTLFKLDRSYQVAVLEMAMRGRGEIRRLSEIAKPDYALITNIGLSHIGRLGSQDAIAEAKAEIFDFICKDGQAILNANDKYFGYLKGRSPVPVIAFGTHSSAMVRASQIEVTEDPGVKFLLETPSGSCPIRLKTPGRHQVLNALSAASIGHILGLSLDEIRRGLENFNSGSMRMEILSANGYRILSDCYNASPASITAALEILHTLSDVSERYAVLGDMKELGDESEKAHLQAGKEAATSADHFITIGEWSSEMARGAQMAGMTEDNIQTFKTNTEIIQYLKNNLHPGDAVLIKGSRAMQMEEIVRGLGG